MSRAASANGLMSSPSPPSRERISTLLAFMWTAVCMGVHMILEIMLSCEAMAADVTLEPGIGLFPMSCLLDPV